MTLVGKHIDKRNTKRWKVKEQRSSETWIKVLNVNRNWISIRKCTIFNVPQRINVFLVFGLEMCVCERVNKCTLIRARERSNVQRFIVEKWISQWYIIIDVKCLWMCAVFLLLRYIAGYITIATRFVPIFEWNSIAISVYRFIYRTEWNRCVRPTEIDIGSGTTI